MGTSSLPLGDTQPRGNQGRRVEGGKGDMEKEYLLGRCISQHCWRHFLGPEKCIYGGCWIFFFNHHQIFLCPWDRDGNVLYVAIHAAKAPAQPININPPAAFLFHIPSDKSVVLREKGL